MSQVYPIPESFQARGHINPEQYETMYAQSIADPNAFWAEQAEAFLTWDTPWHTVSNATFETGEVSWFEGAHLNVTVNCIDRHLPERADQTAIIWEGDDPSDESHITYQELSHQVNKLANGLRQRGVGKGDRVASTCR